MTRRLILALVAIAGAHAAPAAAQSTGIRLACSAQGAQDFSMDARYEDRRGRRKFDASFEAAQNLGFVAGQRVAVSVGGVSVGQMILTRDPANGDITGDLEFDTRRDEGNPFPANFPNVSRGTSIVVGSLGCALN
jgi:hypothetical protein